MLIRPARTEDAPAIAAIYGHYVRHTAITFNTAQPSAAHYREQLCQGVYPFLVCEKAGEILGFAYAGAFRPHDAYRWDAELTIYLRPGQEGRRLGERLLRPLLTLLRRQGFLTAYSCVTLPNPRSVGLHKRLGFTELGVFPHTGYKLGQWRDVVWLSLSLRTFDGTPAEPVAFADLPPVEVAALLTQAEAAEP